LYAQIDAHSDVELYERENTHNETAGCVILHQQYNPDVDTSRFSFATAYDPDVFVQAEIPWTVP